MNPVVEKICGGTGPVPWDRDLLYVIDFKFIPLLYTKKILVGHDVASIQIEIKSAIITSI
jgi:hypothetical protein